MRVVVVDFFFGFDSICSYSCLAMSFVVLRCVMLCCRYMKNVINKLRKLINESKTQISFGFFCLLLLGRDKFCTYTRIVAPGGVV